MLCISIDEKNRIVEFKPDQRLSEDDFRSAVSVIDPYIEKVGKLNGLNISSKDFPGWESIASHLVSAEIKSFAYEEFDTAKAWIIQESSMKVLPGN